MSEHGNLFNMIEGVRGVGEALVAAVKGDIDISNSPLLRSALMGLVDRHRPRKLVLNLSAVSYMDSSAVAVLVEAVRKLGRGGRVVLAGVQPRVRGVFEIARLDTIFRMVQTEEEGLLP